MLRSSVTNTFSRIGALSSAITVLDPAAPPIAGDKAVFGDLAAAATTDKNYQVAYAQLRKRVAVGGAGRSTRRRSSEKRGEREPRAAEGRGPIGPSFCRVSYNRLPCRLMYALRTSNTQAA
jgi:hypothetical protein